jgi:MoaA/NifB/PqqE/SkfB family radical SAM enzyme/SAM-dependent methyltransferase
MTGHEFLAKAMREPAFAKMHPKVAAFFKDYLAHEKVLRFDGHYVLNTHFPPYPSPAFDNLVEHFQLIGDAEDRRLFSVTLAVTNRCHYNCWHCYNAGRCQEDTPLPVLRETIRQLQDLRVVHVTLTGGEPLLREDLEEVAGAFDDGTYLSLNTTASGLTPARARALKDSGVFGLGVSLDSTNPDEHDRMRGKEGAFRTAVEGLAMAAKAGLYPYIIAVATHEFLEPDRFEAFMRFAGDCGAREVHVLEPSATGNLAGSTEALLSIDERRQILDYQEAVARRQDLPILSSFAYVEGPNAFGCGAGLTHLYIDGAGEVCPCNLVPLSFGNIAQEPLPGILEEMGRHFREPRPNCVGHLFAEHVGIESLPLSPEASAALCEKCLPKEHALPRFFQVRAEAQGDVGAEELQAAYNQIHGDYDAFWLVEAGKPVEELVGVTPLHEDDKVLEAGCGTGFATALVAGKLGSAGHLTAVDLSEGMLAEACGRLDQMGSTNVEFVVGDALDALDGENGLDVVFSSWVLGYIPLKPFFERTARALREGGHLAFVVHKENSPREPFDIFWELVARDPSVLKKRVAFDFPGGMAHVRDELWAAGLGVARLWDGSVTFRYDTPEQVLEHLLKSGAGTAFYDAVEPARRDELEQDFLATLAERHGSNPPYDVVHEYVSSVARKP